jgi:hypothetical protein
MAAMVAPSPTGNTNNKPFANGVSNPMGSGAKIGGSTR